VPPKNQHAQTSTGNGVNTGLGKNCQHDSFKIETEPQFNPQPKQWDFSLESFKTKKDVLTGMKIHGQKGVSPTISAVLLAAIAVTFIVIAYFWVSGIQTKTISRGEKTVTEAQNPDDLDIQSAQLNTAGDRIRALFVKNNGDHDVKEVSVFVRGQLACDKDASGNRIEMLKDAPPYVFNGTNCSNIDDIDVSDRTTTEITVTSKNGRKTVTLTSIIREF